MTRSVRVRLLVFVVIGALAILNAGARYAGLLDWIAPSSYAVKVELPRSGGLFERGEVTWRGFTVGRVSDLDFRADGVVATLAIEDRWRIPARLRAEVHNRSAVGEQYLDLVPSSESGPYLRDGSVIPAQATSTPVEEQEVILAVHRLLTSIDTDDLATVVAESGRAFDGASGDIGRLLENSRTILATVRAALPDTVALLRAGRVVLETQDAQASTIQRYLRDLDRVSGVLASRDRDLRRILHDGTTAAAELDRLARGLSPELSGLLTHLVTLTGLTSRRLSELEETLVALPWALASAQTPGRDGRAHFTFVGSLTPGPCRRGYLPPSRWRSALDPQHSLLPDSIGCAEPVRTVPRGADSVHPR